MNSQIRSNLLGRTEYQIDLVIENFEKIIPDAYHGTDFASACNILREKKFRTSTGEHQYLGDGVYFFESSIQEAQNWAKKKTKSVKGGCKYVVFRAIINLGRCLDLTRREHINVILKLKSRLSEKTKKKEIAVSALINFLTYKFDEIDTVRAFNCLGNRLFVRPNIYYTQLIICVKKHECIIDFEKIKEGYI